jgi:hypothetical protein
MSKRTAFVATGVALIVTGGVLAAGGGGLVAAIGADGTLSAGRSTLDSATAALVTVQGDIDASGARSLTDPSLELAVRRSDKPVFVGVGRADDVDRYLAGAPIEKVTDFDVRPFEMTTTVRDGTSLPGPPADQDFWVARSVGATTAATSWAVDEGRYRVVVMNADGSLGIHAEGDFGLHVPRVVGIGISVLVGGLLLLGSGVFLVVVGLRTRPPLPAASTPSPYVAVPL